MQHLPRFGKTTMISKLEFLGLFLRWRRTCNISVHLSYKRAHILVQVLLSVLGQSSCWHGLGLDVRVEIMITGPQQREGFNRPVRFLLDLDLSGVFVREGENVILWNALQRFKVQSKPRFPITPLPINIRTALILSKDTCHIDNLNE